MKAIWENRVIAESGEAVVIEGNHYFPPMSVKREYLDESDYISVCPWKGEAHYYDIVVDGKRNNDAAWYYPDPKKEAENIKGFIAFWKEVIIEM